MADLTTLLSLFLKDLYSGYVGTSTSISGFRAGDGSASAPSYSFASEPNTGWYHTGVDATSLLRLSMNGTFVAAWDTGGTLNLGPNTISFGSGVTSPDVSLSRGAADRLDLATGDSFNLVSGSLRYNNSVLMSTTAPTIGSGFGSSPSIVSSNGATAFTVNVGTGGTASSGVITMPAAATGWVAYVVNITQTAANRANVQTIQTASTTTSITVQNQTISTGAAVAWTASDVLRVIAFAY